MKRRGRVLRPTWIMRDAVQEHPEILFVFADNMARRGFGGQAAAMRDEPNAIGVPTKWRPSTEDVAYFVDSDWENPVVRQAIENAFSACRAALEAGRDVMIPKAGFGSDRAELPARAPRIDAEIKARIKALEEGS